MIDSELNAHTTDCCVTCSTKVDEIFRVIGKISALVDSIKHEDVIKAKANPMLGMLLNGLTKSIK